MTILAIDPGSEQSAWVAYDNTDIDWLGKTYTGKVQAFGIYENDKFLDYLACDDCPGWEAIVIEQIQSYGMAVGKTIFQTVWWTGRFHQAAEDYTRSIHIDYVPRRDVKLHLTGQARAKDANVRMAIMDRYGGDTSKGKKANPGPLYGVSKDVWAALGVAITYSETR